MNDEEPFTENILEINFNRHDVKKNNLSINSFKYKSDLLLYKIKNIRRSNVQPSDNIYLEKTSQTNDIKLKDIHFLFFRCHIYCCLSIYSKPFHVVNALTKSIVFHARPSCEHIPASLIRLKVRLALSSISII